MYCSIEGLPQPLPGLIIAKGTILYNTLVSLIHSMHGSIATISCNKIHSIQNRTQPDNRLAYFAINKGKKKYVTSEAGVLFLNRKYGKLLETSLLYCS